MLGIGFLGIVVPLLPTTPLVLLAAFLFSRSNKRLEAWLERNRIFGPFIINFRTGAGIGRIHKYGSILLLWLGLATSMYFLQMTWVYILLAGIGIGVTTHLLLIKTATLGGSQDSQ